MEVAAGGWRGLAGCCLTRRHLGPGGLNLPGLGAPKAWPPTLQSRLPACLWGGATWCQLNPSHAATPHQAAD